MSFNQIVRRGGSVVRGGVNIANWLGRQVAGNTAGLARRVRPAGGANQATPKPDMDDVTLARKVETDIFRNRRGLKSSVNVNAVDGVVWLRGEVKHPGQIRSLEQEVLAIPEVRGVENLLHLPKTPAPTRADTPRRQQRTRSSTKRPTPRTQTTGRVTDDRTDAIERSAEPSPVEHASDGEGRTPAPMGSQGDNSPAA